MKLVVLAVAAALALPAAAAADPPTATPLETVAVNGVRLGYRDLNPRAGEPLVLIAGYGVTMAERSSRSTARSSSAG